VLPKFSSHALRCRSALQRGHFSGQRDSHAHLNAAAVRLEEGGQAGSRRANGVHSPRLKRNYLVETSAMKRRSIQLRHPATSTRIRSEIAFLSVCVLVGLVAFFAGAHAQVATPGPAATATPAPTATPFPNFSPLRPPRP
jgi:hypothetical protein